LSTDFSLPYGDSFINARVPAGNVSYVLEKREVNGIENEAEAIISSLRSPISCPPLIECVRKNDRVVVLVTDNTRACPEDRMLPPILAELEKKVPSENITIIIALGLHPPLDRETMKKKLGDNIVEKYRVLNHDINDCVYIGTTSRGTPIEINRQVIEADFRISTGLIEPHFFAGFSGGRKIIAPGVFSVRSAYKNHGYDMISHPLARTGNLKGNPVHEDMIEQARTAGLDFIVNVLLNRRGEITHIVAGDFIKAHEKGCEIESKIAGVKVDRRVDISITTNSGAPLDLDLYQTVKGMETASHVTRDGGIIITCSACNTGVGPDEFLEMHRSAQSADEVLQKTCTGEPSGVQWQNQILAHIQQRNDIYLISELEDDIVRDMMMTPFRTVEEALEQAFQVLGRDATIAVIPEGPMVLPILEG